MAERHELARPLMGWNEPLLTVQATPYLLKVREALNNYFASLRLRAGAIAISCKCLISSTGNRHDQPKFPICSRSRALFRGSLDFVLARVEN
ncbi:hypothetical protein XAP7430_100008 [Xanthomonas phaseoli pv. phaseoli]|uniref:Uncharacterized protein n=1 Tax=Xanthomonas campestris pv. phaseoli TaxID=317013 RepID=A0AB38DU87_XANCH|nr:hypothetical protein XAP7430_100008 [Xanthomonas phaseoli pv. phaseoli]